MSLRTKLLVWNNCVFTVAIVLFGILQIVVSRQSALQAIDHDLKGRAQNMGPGQMGPRPGGPLGGGPDLPRRRFDVRRPRVFTLEGKPVDQESNDEPWSRSLLERSVKNQPGFADIKWEGQQLRVFSRPIDLPDDHHFVVQVAQETDSLRLAEKAQLTAFAVALPLIALVSAIFAALLTRMVIGPVAKLTAIAERIATDTNARERISMAGNDEMARLSSAFDAMTDRLQESNVQLKTTLEAQRRFTGDAAHELRTPLTSISLAAENGLHASATPIERVEALERVLRSAHTMQKLTTLLLSLSKLDSANTVLDLVDQDVVPILNSAVAASGLEGDSRLKWSLFRKDARFACNSDALLQIMSNLLENAAAYTPTDGAITIESTPTSLSVVDTGEGIPAEHLPYIFDRFYRADPARSREKGGYGLGLAICKSLAEAQGAVLTVQSTVGVGTRFTLDFSGPSQPS